MKQFNTQLNKLNLSSILKTICILSLLTYLLWLFYHFFVSDFLTALPSSFFVALNGGVLICHSLRNYSCTINFTARRSVKYGNVKFSIICNKFSYVQ